MICEDKIRHIQYIMCVGALVMRFIKHDDSKLALDSYSVPFEKHAANDPPTRPTPKSG